LDYGRGDGNWAADVTFYVHPELAGTILSKLTQRGLHYNVLNHDLQWDIDQEQQENHRVQSRADDTWFESYHNLEEIMLWIGSKVFVCGAACTQFSIGNSYQNRALQVIKLTGEPNSCAKKPTIWIDAGIHAREWIAYSTGMYIIERLIDDYPSDPFVKKMRDDYDWHILPAVNPDGYSYTWSNDRLWRKSRRPTAGSTCIGADINRNFDYQWMTIGASSNPCSETFAGTAPYTEPEAKAVSDYVQTLNGTTDLFITLHTYGQLFMTPWGYTQTKPADYIEMMRVGQAAVTAIRETHGTIYTLGAASEILYESSGTSRDWAKGVPQIPYVYTIELRNLNSFVLPPGQILPTGQEIWAGLRAAIQSMQTVRPPTCK
jgi:carboxypeptidase A2